MDRDEMKQATRSAIIGLAAIIGAFILLALFPGCSPRIVERIRVQRDTIYHVKVDSVYEFHRDSVFVREKGDTVYIYKERVNWRDRWRIDTVHSVRVDSVAVERTKEVKVERPLTAWQRFRLRGFWWLLAGLAGLLAWTFRKPLLALFGKVL